MKNYTEMRTGIGLLVLLWCAVITCEHQWKCEAVLPSQYSLEKVRVGCEGFHSSSDNMILAGSCGLKYEIDYSYSISSNGKNNTVFAGNNGRSSHGSFNDNEGAMIIMLSLVFVGLILVCLQNCNKTEEKYGRRRYRTRRGSDSYSSSDYGGDSYTSSDYGGGFDTSFDCGGTDIR